MNRRRGNNSNRRVFRSERAEVNQLARRLRQMQTSEHFSYPRGRFDPPRIVTNPRWPLVLDTTVIQDVASTQTLTNSSIRTAVRGQLGIPQTYEDFVLYFVRVDLWTTPTDVVSGQASLAMRLCDLDTGAYTQWIEDQGTTARPGHVHALWPVSQSSQPRSSGDFNVLQIDSPAQFTGVLHVHLKLSFEAGDVLPTLRRVIQGEIVPHPAVL